MFTENYEIDVNKLLAIQQLLKGCIKVWLGSLKLLRVNIKIKWFGYNSQCQIVYESKCH